VELTTRPLKKTFCYEISEEASDRTDFEKTTQARHGNENRNMQRGNPKQNRNAKTSTPQLEQYKIQVTAMQETRWLRKGVMDTKTHSILYSGKKDGAHELGVAFIVDQKTKTRNIAFKPIN